ncbi:MAG: hypothetical protein JWM36_3742 [Hyphomicrobiales bacterium]|nr:hypothetical protein [Hyphomicrobiales bacterium]
MSATLTGSLAVLASVLGAFAGGAVWHARALGRAYAAGLVAGRAALQSELAAEVAVQAQASKAALAGARSGIAAMDRRHQAMQEKLDALEDDAPADGADSGLHLAPGLVRKLDAIGRDPGEPRSGP